MKNLKSKIILCTAAAALLFVCTLKANAQDQPKTDPEKVYTPRIEFGVRFMPTFSAFKMQSSDGSTIKGQVRLGYGFGALIGYNFNSHVEIQAEVIYSAISRKYIEADTVTATGSLQDVQQTVNLRYINIPLLFSINTGKFKPVNFNIVLGPQMGILVGSEVRTTGGEGTSSTQAVLSAKKADLGFAYGAGLDFGLNKLSTIRLGFGFRGVYGLFDISDNGPTTTTNSYYILGRTHVETYSGYLGFSFLF